MNPCRSPFWWPFDGHTDMNALRRRESNSRFPCSPANRGSAAPGGHLHSGEQESVTVLWRRYRQEGRPQCHKWDREAATRIGTCLGRSEEPAMAKEELLESEHWRIFRLFLCDLSDEELEGVEEQLEKER